MEIHRMGHGISVLNDQVPVPGAGCLPVNAFVIQSEQPVVIDTGLSLPDRNFLEALGSVLDPADVRWIWLTHPDRDHTGGIFDLLEAAPQAKVVTTFIGMGIMSVAQPLPMDRVFLLNPGQTLEVGDRKLTAFRPAAMTSELCRPIRSAPGSCCGPRSTARGCTRSIRRSSWRRFSRCGRWSLRSC